MQRLIADPWFQFFALLGIVAAGVVTFNQVTTSAYSSRAAAQPEAQRPDAPPSMADTQPPAQPARPATEESPPAATTPAVAKSAPEKVTPAPAPARTKPSLVVTSPTGERVQPDREMQEIFERAPVATLRSHTAPVTALAASRVNDLIASASKDGTVRIWNPVTREVVRTIAVGAPVSALAFSPDGRLVLTGSSDDLARIWDVDSGNELARFSSAKRWVTAVALSPDGRRVLAGDGAGSLWLFDRESGQLIASVPAREGQGHSSWITGVGFADNDTAVSTSSDGFLKLWGADALAYRNFAGGPGSSVRALSLSPDARMLAALGNNQVTLVDAANGNPLREIRASQVGPLSIAFSPDSQLLVTLSQDGRLKVWDARGGHLLQTLNAPTECAPGLAFQRDGRILASAAADGTIVLWAKRAG